MGPKFKRGATLVGGAVLAVSAVAFTAHEIAEIRSETVAPYVIEVQELPAVYTEIPPAAVAIDPDAILELSTLLNQFVPLAQAHNIEFDYQLVEALQQESGRVGISLPVTVSVAGATNFHTPHGITSLFLPDEAAELADKLAGATQAWISTLSEATTVTRVPANAGPINEVSLSRFGGIGAENARFSYAPASRSGARAGQPVTASAVRELAVDFDQWLNSESEAAAASAANFRARMVALSRAHGNGRLPAEVLCPIPFSPRFTMRCDVIDSLVELNNAFRAHFGRDVVVRSGYRANPGTSNHGWGLAVDFGGQLVNFGTSEFNWMNANARQFGWGHAFWAVPGGLNPQPWHWEAMDEIREMTGRWR